MSKPSAHAFRSLKERQLKAKKEQLRARLLKRRTALSAAVVETASTAVQQQLLAWPGLKKIKSLMCYVAVDHEIQTRELIKQLLVLGKTVAVPEITGPGEMRAVRLTNLEQLVPGPHQIMTVKAGQPMTKYLDLNLLPAVAVDRQGRRLGMGGGYYDRFLDCYQSQLNLALIFHFQVVSLVPAGARDQLVDGFITEEEFYQLR